MTKKIKAVKTQMATVASVEALSAADEGAILAAMLGEAGDEIVEQAALDLPADDDVLAVVATIEKAEATDKLYADQDTVAAAPVTADTPKKKAKVVLTEEEKAAAAALKAAAKAEKAAAKAAAKALLPPAVPRVTRVGNKESVVLAAKLGDKAGDFLVLELADALLDADTLKTKQAEVLASIDLLAKKVGEKATMLFGYMKNGGKLNDVMERTFRTLVADGVLTSGNKGNLQTNLLSKPYSAGTAASQSNQMFMLLPALKITVKEKGRMVPNPDSLILMKVKAELGLA